MKIVKLNALIKYYNKAGCVLASSRDDVKLMGAMAAGHEIFGKSKKIVWWDGRPVTGTEKEVTLKIWKS